MSLVLIVGCCHDNEVVGDAEVSSTLVAVQVGHDHSMVSTIIHVNTDSELSLLDNNMGVRLTQICKQSVLLEHIVLSVGSPV